VVKITDKLIRVSYETWNQLRKIAYHNDSKIKTMFEEIMSGKIDPTTGKTL
jgi:hypothetical protein